VQVKKKFNGLILAVMCLFLNACVAPEKMSRSMSDEEKANLYLQMGVRYLEMNMLKIAQEKLNIALSFNPEDAELQNALGVMHERLQQNTAAGQQYKKAVKMQKKAVKLGDDQEVTVRNDLKSRLAKYEKALKK